MTSIVQGPACRPHMKCIRNPFQERTSCNARERDELTIEPISGLRTLCLRIWLTLELDARQFRNRYSIKNVQCRKGTSKRVNQSPSLTVVFGTGSINPLRVSSFCEHLELCGGGHPCFLSELRNMLTGFARCAQEVVQPQSHSLMSNQIFG